MATMEDYEILDELIYRPGMSVVRATRHASPEPVILKIARFTAFNDPAHKKTVHEFEYGKNFHFHNILNYRDLVTTENSVLVEMDDFRGVSLETYTQQNELAIGPAIAIAMGLTVITEELHYHGIIHYDLRPVHFLIDPDTFQVRLLDLGRAASGSLVSEGNQAMQTLAALEYNAPEQSGLMEAGQDFRVDYYHLGVIFYRLFTGKLPFESTDPNELVHAHMARSAVSPLDLAPGIPSVVSDMILKLMSKKPEERYQTSHGIRYDLAEYRHITVAGDHDRPGEFNLPDRLYGREEEVNAVLGAFARVGQANEIVLISGKAGIGKSSLITGAEKALDPREVLFVRGKFDQYVQNIPFEAVIEAFKELVCKISCEDRAHWKAAILNAVGQFGKIITEVIPELEKVIGPQPPVEELTPVESQNRFVNVFTNFINVFTTATRPLVIFLDDLQWADRSSLRFLARVTYSVMGTNLLIIGTYRDDEVGEEHPLKRAIADLEAANANLLQIRLDPLHLDDIVEIVSDTLSCPPPAATPLAQILLTRTLGNPFFVGETLADLHQQGFLKYHPGDRRWLWDSNRITGYALSDSSLELLVFKIRNLAERTRNALTTASCIGSVFELITLSALSDKTPQEMQDDLREALTENLISTAHDRRERSLATGRYRFVHDQVQQAAYNLLSGEERAALHVEIGYFLLDRLTAVQRQDRLFEIVNHLNHHTGNFEPAQERHRIAALNLEAGNKSKISAAYSVALAYFKKGTEMLAAHDWQEAYPLSMALHLGYAECAYLAGEPEVCLEIAAQTLQYAKGIEDRARIHQVRIQCLIFNEESDKAFELSLNVLRELGIKFPRNPGNAHVVGAYLRSKWLLRGRKIADLEHLPAMTNVQMLVSMQILQNITAIVFSKSSAMYALMVMKMVELSVRYGISPESAITFATYGAILNAIEGNRDVCYRYGQLSLRLAGNIGSGAARNRAVLVYNIVNRPSGELMNNSLEPLRNAYQTGVEMGDVEYCSYASSSYSFHLLLSGKNLHWVLEEMLRFRFLPRSLSKKEVSHHNEALIQVVCNLLDEHAGPNPENLSGAYFDEGENCEAILALPDQSRIFACFTYKMMLAYLAGHYAQGIESAGRALGFHDSIIGTLFEPLYAFFDGLLNIGAYRQDPGNRRLLRKGILRMKKMRKLASQVPVNFEHRYYLLEAEIHAVSGRGEQAILFYDKAVKTALEYGHVHEAALANELSGRYWAGNGQSKMAAVYLTAALEGYQEWGCGLKSRQLLRDFPEILSGEPAVKHQVGHITGDPGAVNLDLSTLMKVSTAISSEVVFGKLMDKLMQFAIENAGAQSGYFILDWGGELVIEAQRSVLDEESDIRKIPLNESDQVPASIVAHVFRTKSEVVLQDAMASTEFRNDPAVASREIRSALCTAALNQGKVVGVLYLENNLATGAFTSERVQLLRLLSGQIAVAIENAILYEKLEQKVAVRTAEIQVQKQQIERQKLLIEEKSRYKEQFFANMSHEIRTPMTAILGMSELLFDTTLNPKQLEYAKGIRYSSENLLAIINDILDYSKIEAGKFSFVDKPFQLRDRMERLGYILRGISDEKGLRLNIHVDPGVRPQLIGDPVRLHQILLNLAGNAIKFTDSGSVSISVSVESEEAGKQQLHFSVADTGMGIAEDKLEYIFETFTRIDEELGGKQSGTGLGLFIAKKLVEEQGGQMQVRSKLGEGSQFGFTLTFEICGPEQEQEREDEDLHMEGVKVLLVEDNLFNQVVAEETLKKIISNVKVTIADNGQLALDKLALDHFDIILMDVKMPVMDGYQATRHIRQTELVRNIPILAFTSNANPAEAQKCRDAGMDDYLTKPIEIKKLKQKIGKLLRLQRQNA